MKHKERVFAVLAGITRINEFESWIYQDERIQASIVSDESTLRLVSIDFSGKYVLLELEKYCFDIFDEDEFYVYVIEENAKGIIETEDSLEVIRYTKNICKYFDWDDIKDLFYTFHILLDQYDDFPYSGYSSKSQIIEEIKLQAVSILGKFETANLAEKKTLVSNGCGSTNIPSVYYQPPPKYKRWYEFWK